MDYKRQNTVRQWSFEALNQWCSLGGHHYTNTVQYPGPKGDNCAEIMEKIKEASFYYVKHIHIHTHN